MPVRSVINQYRGVNAHLHSFWQASGTWNRFHNAHITHLTESLRAVLLPLGYVAEMEESLQIRRLGDDFPRRPKSDVMIYDTDPQRLSRQASSSPVSELTVAELIEEEDIEHPYFAVAIQPLFPDMRTGEAVAWIELLSPTNKGRSDDAAAYIGKRRAMLDAGLVFVELDYLHETPPTFPRRVQDYTTGHPNAHPYRIAVLDPRPDLQHGPADVYEFDIDDPIPTVTIPLSADDSLTYDFGEPYQQMLKQGHYTYSVDYAELPMNFENYSEADQTRIARRMLAVLEAAHNGLDLETGPFPVKEVSLADALKQIAALKT